MILDLPGDFRIIAAFQACGDWLTPIMKFFTWLGYPQAYMLIIAVIYWSIDRKLGLRLGLYLPLLASLNSLLKQAFHAPRPYWLNPDINTPMVSNGFGMPSGHAQGATVWLYAACFVKKRVFWLVAIFLVFMIGISRVYLGVHFPSQVVAGWLTGIALLVIAVRLEHSVLSWFLKKKLRSQLLLLIGCTLLILLLGAVIGWLWRNWEMPLEWILNASDDLAVGEKSLAASRGMSAVAGNSGGFLGAALAAMFSHRQGGFNSGGPFWKRLVRTVAGLVLLAVLYGIFEQITPDPAKEVLHPVWQFFGFFVISFSAIYLVPHLFKKIGLST